MPSRAVPSSGHGQEPTDADEMLLHESGLALEICGQAKPAPYPSSFQEQATNHRKVEMRIAFLTPEYVTETAFSGGGLANYLNRVSQGLVERGHDVEVFTVSRHNETLEHRGVIVHRVLPEWKWFFRINRFLGNGMPITKGMILETYSLRQRFLQRHAAVPFDIVQAADFRSPGLAISLSRTVPVVTRVSGLIGLWDKAYRLKRTTDHKVREWLQMQALRRSARVYAPSEFMARTVAKEAKIHVDVVRPPFFIEEDDRDYQFYEGTLKRSEYLLFAGTVGRLKGAFVLADSLVELLPRFPEMHVALAGIDTRDTAGRSSVERFKGRLHCFADRVHYLGPIPHVQLYPLLEKARVVALPSLVDNLPNSCMEAMALGSVVVASEGVSFDELIEDGKSGFLREVGNSHALAEGIARAWCLTESQRAALTRNAKASLAALDPELTLTELEEYFEAVVSDRSEQGRGNIRGLNRRRMPCRCGEHDTGPSGKGQ